MAGVPYGSNYQRPPATRTRSDTSRRTGRGWKTSAPVEVVMRTPVGVALNKLASAYDALPVLADALDVGALTGKRLREVAGEAEALARDLAPELSRLRRRCRRILNPTRRGRACTAAPGLPRWS